MAWYCPSIACKSWPPRGERVSQWNPALKLAASARSFSCGKDSSFPGGTHGGIGPAGWDELIGTGSGRDLRQAGVRIARNTAERRPPVCSSDTSRELLLNRSRLWSGRRGIVSRTAALSGSPYARFRPNSLYPVPLQFQGPGAQDPERIFEAMSQL